MLPYFSEVYGNASAVHQEGVSAKAAVEEARTSLGRTLRVRPSDVIFTSGGTESNNLAIDGVLRALRATGRSYADMEIISTRVEHPSVSEVLRHVADLGVTIKYADINEEGLIDVNHFKALLSEKTVLATMAYVNSEIGVIQPVKKLTRAVKLFNAEHDTNILVHLDAAQAPLWLPVQLDSLGCDLLSLDAGKCYGPKGVGILATRHGVKLLPIMLGGSQESGLRAGTENTPLIVGCVKAIVRAQEEWESRSERVRSLRDSFITDLESAIDGVLVNGSRTERVANNINISIPGIDTEFAVISLDQAGIAASTKSACSGADGGGSTVVREMSDDDARAQSTIRFSLSEASTTADLQKTTQVLKDHIIKMRDFHKNLTK